MRIVDENGVELTGYDPLKGYLKETELLIQHHPAVKAIPEQGHYEVVAEYPNGGRDVEWVVDVPGVEAREAYDETEQVLMYTPYTELELRVREFEKNRQPLTILEITELLLAKLVSTLVVDDALALRMAQFYPEWEPGLTLITGARVRWDDKLWRTRQGHATQTGWDPENAPALFEVINEAHAGTLEDPIPYDGNMALVKGLYYYQEGLFYQCTRDTVNPVYHTLKDLVGLYVEVAE